LTKGDALFEVETDKATMEVEAQASGFLTDVTAAVGEDVPVGQAIARISETAQDTTKTPADPEPASAPKTEAGQIPDGKTITMPQLGMAQDSGVLVGWLVALGAKVSADDLLFEVETDKATMEVPAGTDGYLAATLAQAGDDVPVGQAVAIISADKPESPVAQSAAKAAPAKPAPQTTETPAPPKPRAAEPVAQPHAAADSGRVLASPKLRRIAREKGLDLDRLVQAGHPQPYHMRDLAALARLGADTPAPAHTVAAQVLRLEAACAQDGFGSFADWAASATDVTDADALLAGLAGASTGGAATIALDRFGKRRVFAVPQGRSLSAVAQTDAPPDLRLRDLRATNLAPRQHGGRGAAGSDPDTGGMRVWRSCWNAAPTHAPEAAIALLSEFAGRMHDPLRHLL
jgi:pyruvate/2-oxoglutarate dehydrogenase complex dihydrolipoamide acyltransferase (E2) component